MNGIEAHLQVAQIHAVLGADVLSSYSNAAAGKFGKTRRQRHVSVGLDDAVSNKASREILLDESQIEFRKTDQNAQIASICEINLEIVFQTQSCMSVSQACFTDIGSVEIGHVSQAHWFFKRDGAVGGFDFEFGKRARPIAEHAFVNARDFGVNGNGCAFRVHGQVVPQFVSAQFNRRFAYVDALRLEVGKLQCQSTGNHVARTHATGQMAALKCCAEIVNVACRQIGVDDG